MKLTLTILLFSLASVTASTYSQNTRLDIAFEDGNITELFQEIQEQSEFYFFYQKEALKELNNVAVNAKDATVMEILDKVLAGKNINYEIVDRYIVVRPVNDSFGNEILASVREANSAQQQTVSGQVTDASGQALPGVTVVVKGTTQGTVTNADGEYTLSDIPEDATLVFSFVGMRTQDVEVGDQTSIDVTMEEEAIGLEEVVAIGYGTQRRENVIGSVTAVHEEELTSAPVGRVSNALAGRLPGGIFMQESGEPGNDAAIIRVRGNSTFNENQPLVVIDGIPGRDLNSLNPEDIESISVLKDASAAIYGARAANGVILVTTKSGTEDMPATFTYNFYEGFLSPSKLPKLTDAPTYARMIREMQSYRDVDESNMLFSEEDIAKYESGEYPWTHPNTDWYAEALKDYSTTRHHNFSVAGGTQNVTYHGSFGTQFDDGIYTNSATSYNRYNLKLNMNAKINEYLSIGLDVNGIQENRMYPTKSATSIFQGIIRMYPTSHALMPGTDLPGPDIEYGDQPMVSASKETGFDDDKRYRSNNLLTATLKIPGIKGLSLTGYYAYDKYIRHRKLFQKPWTLYSLDETAYLNDGNTGKEDGTDYIVSKTIGYPEPRVRNFSQQSTSKTANIKADYVNTFNEIHNVEAFIAYEQNEYENGGFDAFRRFFVSDRLPYLFAGGDEEKDNGEYVGLDARVNYFGRLSYNYQSTYFFQFSFRRDGSLRFSEESGRWGNFPSVLLGYRPSEQGWWQNNISFINDFKLRASWGQLGNDQVDAFQYLTSYGFAQGYTYGASKSYTAGLNQANVPNPFITWEVANILNIGWDARMIDNKLTFETDLFYERRTDILVERDVSVPRFTGISLPDENFGITENRGIELLLAYRDRKDELTYGLSGNFAFSRNKVIEMDEPERPVPWQTRTGHPMNALLLYKKIGIFSDWDEVNSTPHVSGARPGDIIIEDFDGDGEITTDDRQLFPLTTTPEITYGVSFDVSYKNWELRGLLQGQSRALRYIYTDGRIGSAGNYFQYDADDRWTPENTDATKPRAYERVEEYWRDSHITDHHYADISFLRLKNLQFSYNIPQLLANQVMLKNAKVFAAGQNLWLIYSGNKIMDPETNGMGAYPIMRVISVGAQISF
ncbi:MAG: TonB-dependent receptor [Mariniphaga sp.]